MFELINWGLGLLISLAYPLKKTYILLFNHRQKQNQLPQLAISSMTGSITLTLEEAKLFEEYMAYWIIISICYYIQTLKPISFLLSILPFSSFVLLYLQCWLVFPLVPLENRKVTGTYIIYTFYSYKYMAIASHYFDNAIVRLFEFYNTNIDNKFPLASFMKVNMDVLPILSFTSQIPPSQINGVLQNSPELETIDTSKGLLSSISGLLYGCKSFSNRSVSSNTGLNNDQGPVMVDINSFTANTDYQFQEGYSAPLLLSALLAPLNLFAGALTESPQNSFKSSPTSTRTPSPRRDETFDGFAIVTEKDLKNKSNESLSDVMNYSKRSMKDVSAGDHSVTSGSSSNEAPASTTQRKSSWTSFRKLSTDSTRVGSKK